MDMTHARDLLAAQKARLAKYEDAPVVGLGIRLYRRDRVAQGSVVGSAIAFRLFLFFVPLLLFVVGVAGFVSGFVSAHDVDRTAGVSGTLAVEINAAFDQPGATRWFAVLFGLFGMISAGRLLSKALWSASATAWQLPSNNRAPFRVIGSLFGLVCTVGLLSVIENRLRAQLGLGVATASLVGVFVLYFVAWLLISTMLPRASTDPGASLPGSIVVGLTLTGMGAVSQFYLPDHIHRASQLYGAIATTIVTLGWFLIIGRAIVVSMEFDAVLHERLGTVSQYFFALPVVRVLPRRSQFIRRFFDLDLDVDLDGSITNQSDRE
jgi:uncharacterized BrkB/YihY/UPF0761 family membrane protein